MWCDHLNETSLAVHFHGTIYIYYVVLTCSTCNVRICVAITTHNPLQHYFHTIQYLYYSCAPTVRRTIVYLPTLTPAG